MKPPSIGNGLPGAQGLYDPRNEHDACGIGFVANIKGHKSHDIIVKGIQVLVNLTHRGACGCDPETGDGAGIGDERPLSASREALPLAFLKRPVLAVDLPPHLGPVEAVDHPDAARCVLDVHHGPVIARRDLDGKQDGRRVG